MSRDLKATDEQKNLLEFIHVAGVRVLSCETSSSSALATERLNGHFGVYSLVPPKHGWVALAWLTLLCIA